MTRYSRLKIACTEWPISSWALISAHPEMGVLKQNEKGASVNDICRAYRVSQAQFYKWRSKYGGMGAPMLKRLKEFEEENNRVKKNYAEEKVISAIGKEAIEKAVRPSQRKEVPRKELNQFVVSFRLARLCNERR